MSERKMIEFENNEELESYVEEHKIIKDSIFCDFNISLNTDLIVKGNITAEDISYNAVCFAYNDIECKSITGRRENHKHFVLDGKIIFKEKEVVKGDE